MRTDRGMTPHEIHCVAIGVGCGSWWTPPFVFERAALIAFAVLVGLHFWRLVFIPIYRWQDRIVEKYRRPNT